MLPIWDGYALTHESQRFQLAGLEITNSLMNSLNLRGHSLSKFSDRELIRELKEDSCFVSQSFDADFESNSSLFDRQVTLRNGESITVGKERFLAPEALFKPWLLRRDQLGLHEAVFQSIMRCDTDLRRDFFQNIVVSGGTTSLPGTLVSITLVSIDWISRVFIRSMIGFETRLERELEALVPRSVKVRVVSSPQGKFLPWIGASIWTSLTQTLAGSYDSFFLRFLFVVFVSLKMRICRRWISIEEYDETGPGVSFWKCL